MDFSHYRKYALKLYAATYNVTRCVNLFINQVKERVIEVEKLDNESQITEEHVYKLLSNRDEIFALLYFNKRQSSSTSSPVHVLHFQNNKRCLTSFLYWFNEFSNYSNKIDKSILSYVKSSSYTSIRDFEVKCFFYKDVRSIIEYIDSIGVISYEQMRVSGRKFLPYDRTQDWYTLKSICICVWNGVPMKELPNLLKDDIRDIDGEYYIDVRGNLIKISKYEYYVLCKFKESTQDRSSTCRITKFSDTPYLFRPLVRSDVNCEQIELSTLNEKILSFNKDCKYLNMPKLLDPRHLIKLVKFYRAYKNYKFDREKFEIDLFGFLNKRYSSHVNAWMLYNVWAETYYKKGVNPKNDKNSRDI